MGIISALSLAPPGAAQSGYEIRSAVVTPEYGYEDFTYSAQIWMSEQAASKVGVIAVTKFSMKLNIYDQGQSVYSESSPSQTGMSQTSFVFGPYSFKDRFDIDSTSNATFEFIFYAGEQQVAKTARIKGPIVQPPTLTGIQFEKNPYFFQGISVSAGFKDLDGQNPRPTCHLEITGPLGAADNRSWTTADVSCQASGKSTYSCTVSEDLSSYRNGGDFTFHLIYNNLKLDPLTYGPYNFSLQPYHPAVEKVTISKLLDYTNFSVQAYVKDVGARMIGGSPDGSVASLIISHPQKGEMIYVSSEPTVRGSSLVYEWTSENVPALFNRSDVQLARMAPFQAKVVYKNQNWDYQAEKSNISFRVVEEIPKLDLQYPTTVYVRPAESSTQDIIATVTFSKGAGDMNLVLSGPDHDLNLTEKAMPLPGNKYQYKWQVTFDDRHVNNNYTMKPSFVHPALEGGRYAFEDRFIRVAPLSVQFSQASVTPTTGLCNGSYTYSLKIDTTIVPLEVRLQTYEPCSSEWTDKGAKKATVESSRLNWTLSPFSYECPEMQQEGAKYRFKASFAGTDYLSKPYQGPTFKGGSPVLISLDSDPVVYVSEGSESSSSIAAVVEYAAGQGQAVLRLNGPEKSIEETSQGIALGANRYRYEWSLLFNEADIGKSFNYTISYKHESLAAEMPLTEKSIAVKAITISFADATVAPAKGKWNDTYAYSVPVKSSAEMKVALEVYNPCTREWVERASGTALPGEGPFNLTARPFKYKCTDAQGKEASYRFVARFAGERLASNVYSGPLISGGNAELVSLDYMPVLYVAKDSTAYQVVRATIESPLGPGRTKLSLNGPEMNFEQEYEGAFLGGERYTYTWSVPFGLENVGEHTFSLSYLNDEIPGGEISFPEQSMTVIEETVLEGGQPQLLYMDYSPILYIEDNQSVLQNITAEVFSTQGEGELDLAITGPDKKAANSLPGEETGEGVYTYRWSEPFDATNIGKSYTISSTYRMGEESYAFNDRIMSVADRKETVGQIWEPALNLRYDPIVDIPAAPDAEGLQHIKATVIYPDGVGKLKLNISGDSKRFEEILPSASTSKNRSVYERDVPFNGTHAGKSYKISLSYMHPSLPGGEYRFTDYFMRVRQENVSNIAPVKKLPQIKGYVDPKRGVLQAWQEKDKLYAFTYIAQISNLSPGELPWVELSVKAPGRSWKLVGEKQQYDPAQGNLSWTVKPFFDTEFLGNAEYKFLVDGRESEVFEGPEIVAIYKDLSYQKSTIPVRFNYFGKINSSINLTVDLLSSEDNVNWRNIGKPQKYIAGSKEVPIIWKDLTALRYFEFDIKTAAGEVIS